MPEPVGPMVCVVAPKTDGTLVTPRIGWLDGVTVLPVSHAVWTLPNVEQILAYRQSTTNGVLYTVPSGKVAYITTLAISGASSGNGFIAWEIRTASATRVIYHVIHLGPSGHDNEVYTFNPPITLPEGYNIYTYGTVLLDGYVFVHGYTFPET